MGLDGELSGKGNCDAVNLSDKENYSLVFLMEIPCGDAKGRLA